MKTCFASIIVALLFNYDTTNGVIEFNQNGKEGVVFHEPYPLGFVNIKQWNPILQEVLYYDSLVFNKHFEELGGFQKGNFINNEPIIAKNENNYLIQAYGYYKKNERMLYINYFWKNEAKDHPFWKERLVIVFGATSHYWEIIVNRDKKTYSVSVGGLEVINCSE